MEHAVIVHLPLSDGRFGSSSERVGLFEVQEQMASAIREAGAGEFDGDEMGEGECVLFMYGPNADRLFEAVQAVLKSSKLAAGGYAIKRYGEAGDPKSLEVRVTW